MSDAKQVAEMLAKVRGTPIVGGAPGHSHTKVIPLATYSPWMDDASFVTTFNTINRNTLVDYYRCHELWTLVAQTAKVGGDILEVGVWKGGTGCLMAARAKALGLPAMVFLCDTFAGVVNAGEKDFMYKGGEHADTSDSIVAELAARLDVLSNIEILKGIFPTDTGDRVADRRFALCHIDVDVYQSAKEVLDWVWPRLEVGGVVVFDDYGFISCDGVARMVNERLDQPGAVVLHNLNGHAVMVKVAA